MNATNYKTVARPVHVELVDIYAARRGDTVHTEATAWVYWGDGYSSCASFAVGFLFDLDENENVQLSGDTQDHDDINQCLRNGLGLLGPAFKAAILEMLMDAAIEEVRD